MRLLISFLLSLSIYILIVFLFLKFLTPVKKNEKKVYIHTAIIAKKAKINSNAKKNSIEKVKKTEVAKIKKVVKKVKKSGSKTNITHGGSNIAFNDIFKNVDYNVETKKIQIKKQLDMSRFKGVERDLQKIKKVSFEVNFVQNSGQKLSKEEINDIISRKLSVIWDEISTLPIYYAKINIENNNGVVLVNILDSNLPNDRQTLLIEKIKNEKFNKNFNITVLFQSKVNND